MAWFGHGPTAAFAAAVQEAPSQSGVLDLGDRTVSIFESHRTDKSAGRRLRAFAALVRGYDGGTRITLPFSREPILTLKRPITYGALLQAVEQSPSLANVRERLGQLPLRCHPSLDVEQMRLDAIPPAVNPSDPELHPALQDLGYTIIADVSAACEAFNNPDFYYPGVDEGIEPVTDEHVKLVIWGMQRELNRERRSDGRGSLLPAAPLAELPWLVQRALAERRRLRYAEWGISRQNWLDNRWSLWAVPGDSDWRPGWNQ